MSLLPAPTPAGVRSALVDTARSIAHRAHDGVLDKVGAPYIDHVEFVASYVAHLGEDYEALALLHDVVEDTNWTLSAIEVEMVRNDVVLDQDFLPDLDALTKRPHEPNRLAYARAGARRRPRRVKRPDVGNNSGRARLAQIADPVTRARLVKKYDLANEVLDECAERAGDSDRSVWTGTVERSRGERACITTHNGAQVEIVTTWGVRLPEPLSTVTLRAHSQVAPDVHLGVQLHVYECVVGRPLRMDIHPPAAGEEIELRWPEVREIDVWSITEGV